MRLRVCGPKGPPNGCPVADWVAIAGPRRLPAWARAEVQSVVAGLVRAGFAVSVGCSQGADAAAIRAAGPAGCRVFAAWGPRGAGAVPVSAVREVLAHGSAAGAVTWWAGGGPSVPARARLARRTHAVIATANRAAVVWLAPGSSGSLLAARAAARAGLPVIAFPLYGELPSLGMGQWASGLPGRWARARKWTQAPECLVTCP